MSAAPQPVRRPAAQAARAPQAAASRSVRGFAPVHDADEDEIKLNLADLPRMDLKNDLEVEGFRPSLLSRIFDLFSRR